MQKIITWLLLMAMLVLPCAALAEDAASAEKNVMFTMAGFDDESAGHDWDSNLFFRRMEEKTGVSFAFYQYQTEESWKTAKTEMLGGFTDLPDVMFKATLSAAEQQEWYAAGKIIDLRPYLEQYASNLWAQLQAHPEWLEAITLPDGAIVALPGINELQNNNVMWINTVWLEQLKLEKPTTIEELENVLRAFRDNDPNLNHKKDEIPVSFSSMWDLRFLGHAFGLAANDYYIYQDENGNAASILTSDENRAFLTWLHKLWEEKLISNDGFSVIDSTRRITDEDATMTYGMFFSPTPMNLVSAAGMDEYGLLMPLVYDGKQIYRDITGALIPGTYAITSACEDPATLVSWVDFLYTEEGCHLAQAGAEGVEYEWNSDGTWDWMVDADQVASTILTEVTIADGGPMPGLSSVNFQMNFDDAKTHKIISEIVELKKVSVLPYPYVYLTEEEQARVNKIHADAGFYAEQQMVWFVTGDVPLNDDTWNDFCQTLKDKGMDEMIAIWQNAAK